MNVRPSHDLLNISLLLIFPTFLLLGVPEGQTRENEGDTVFEQRRAENFQN